MPTVKILIDGVGDWNAGDIVKDAPPGLVNIAEKGTRNAATGERVAEIVEEQTIEALNALQAKAKALKIKDFSKMSGSDLEDAVAAAEEAEKQKQEVEEALKSLLAKAAELKIEGVETMTAEQLTAAIEAAGGGNGGQ